MGLFLSFVGFVSFLFFLKKIGVLMPLKYEDTHIDDNELERLKHIDSEENRLFEEQKRIEKQEAERRRIKQENENKVLWSLMEKDYEDLFRKDPTIEERIIDIQGRLTLDDYYKNPKHLKVETDDLKENEDGSFELKVAYKVEKRKVGDVIEF